MPEPGIEPGSSRAAVWRVTSRPARQIDVSIGVKLFNCFNEMGHSIKKKSHVASVTEMIMYLTAVP